LGTTSDRGWVKRIESAMLSGNLPEGKVIYISGGVLLVLLVIIILILIL
jgi:hypothetical protein